MRKSVVYYRKRSDDNLQQQKEAVAAYLSSLPKAKVLCSFTEEEGSTGAAKRPELKRAVEWAEKEKALLVVPCFVTLARSPLSLRLMLDCNIGGLIALDCLTLTQKDLVPLLAVAEAFKNQQREKASATMQRAVAQGEKFGFSKPDHARKYNKARQKGSEKGVEKSRDIRQKKHENFLRGKAAQMTLALRAKGQTYREIADTLTQQHMLTPRGKTKWYPATVQRLERECKAL